MPFRTWCTRCVMGRAKDDPHFKRLNEAREVPRVGMDYMWLHENAEERRGRKKKELEGIEERSIEAMPILIIKDEESKTIMAEVVPRKGLDKYAVEKVWKMVDSLGDGNMILKSDQEPSIMALKTAVKDKLRGDVKTEESPVG